MFFEELFNSFQERLHPFYFHNLYKLLVFFCHCVLRYLYLGSLCYFSAAAWCLNCYFKSSNIFVSFSLSVKGFSLSFAAMLALSLSSVACSFSMLLGQKSYKSNLVFESPQIWKSCKQAKPAKWPWTSRMRFTSCCVPRIGPIMFFVQLSLGL